jgi:DNA polymerase III subunit delta'
MAFELIIGQSRAKTIFSRALQNHRVPHAYIFTGLYGVGKEAMALELAKALFCKADKDKPCQQCPACRQAQHFNHPDLIYFFPIQKSADEKDVREILDQVSKDPYSRKSKGTNPSIGIDQIREIRKTSALKPLGKNRVVVIAEAEKMTLQASNSLLKILEEPPTNTYFILTSSHPSALLSTIISRCQQVRFSLLTDKEIESALVQRQNIDPEQARLVAGISQGSYRKAVEWLDEDFQQLRQMALDFLRTCFKDYNTKISFIEQVSKSMDKQTIKDMLKLDLLWFRDAFLIFENNNMTQNRNADFLVNSDQIDTLTKFTEAFEAIAFDQVFFTLEQAISYVDRNININLTLMSVFNQLQQSLKIRGTSS